MWCLLGCRKKREGQRGDRFHSLISGFGTGEMMRPFAEIMNLVQFFPPGREPYILSKISHAPVLWIHFSCLFKYLRSLLFYTLNQFAIYLLHSKKQNKNKCNKLLQPHVLCNYFPVFFKKYFHRFILKFLA